jgi:hypothetical protein
MRASPGPQTLIAARRADLHRRLGIGGAVLAGLMLVVGHLTAVAAARQGVTPPGGPPPLVFLAVPLGALVVFAILPLRAAIGHTDAWVTFAGWLTR